MKKAFSLIELLISLIIISLVTAAFAPIITKKSKHQNVTYSTAQQMKIDCTPFDAADGTCLLCTQTQCNLCTSSINVPDGYYVNPSISCNRQSCTNFDSQCKRCTKDGCQECKSGYTLNSSTKRCNQIKCNKGYKVVGSSCVKCDANTIQPNDNSTAAVCSACSDSQVSNEERTACIAVTCNAGQYRNGRNCYVCSSGQYQSSNSFSGTACTSCSSAHANCSACNATNGCCTACSGEWVVSSCACGAPVCAAGKYWNGSTCANCSSPCATCSNAASSCTSCISGYQLSGTICNAMFDTKTFYYTGGVQTWSAPYSGTFKFEVWGAQGGARRASGGLGGYAQGRKTLNAGQTVYIYVGGMGGAPTGGYNGGGSGGSTEGGGGGGATDIRIGGTSLANRIIVAGGGGGGGYGYVNRDSTGGSGGGASGGAGTNSCSYCGSSGVGIGGTQSSGAYLGSGSSPVNDWEGGGGGGGYFGGTYGGNYNGGTGGGGGSGYIGGVSSGSMSNGVRAGHGEAAITKI